LNDSALTEPISKSLLSYVKVALSDLFWDSFSVFESLFFTDNYELIVFFNNNLSETDGDALLDDYFGEDDIFLGGDNVKLSAWECVLLLLLLLFVIFLLLSSTST